MSAEYSTWEGEGGGELAPAIAYWDAAVCVVLSHGLGGCAVSALDLFFFDCLYIYIYVYIVFCPNPKPNIASMGSVQ